MQDTLKVGQMLLRMFASAVGRVCEPGRGRIQRPRRTIIANISPQPASLGLAVAGSKHRHGRIVSMQFFGGHYIAPQCFDQRSQQLAAVAYPLGQRGALQINALSRIDIGLSEQWQVITKLRGEHVGQQARSGKATFHRAARCGRLQNRVAFAAAHPGAHMADHHKAGRYVLQHFGSIFAKLLQSTAAIRAVIGSWHVRMHFARQMIGQGTSSSVQCFCG